MNIPLVIISNYWKIVCSLGILLVSFVPLLIGIQIFIVFYCYQQCCSKYLLPIFLDQLLFFSVRLILRSGMALSKSLISCHTPKTSDILDLFLHKLTNTGYYPTFVFCWSFSWKNGISLWFQFAVPSLLIWLYFHILFGNCIFLHMTHLKLF